MFESHGKTMVLLQSAASACDIVRLRHVHMTHRIIRSVGSNELLLVGTNVLRGECLSVRVRAQLGANCQAMWLAAYAYARRASAGRSGKTYCSWLPPLAAGGCATLRYSEQLAVVMREQARAE
jgi:hypothetical protein